MLLDLRPDDLRAVVENAIQQAQPSAERKGVELVMNVPDKPIRQRHDPQRLGQVVGNLIGNAIKFTPSGGRVDVTLTSTKKGAEVRVADTGVGINAAELPFVFERFYRGAEANESRAAGSGLGLSIVRSIVEMHNGRVAITQHARQGHAGFRCPAARRVRFFTGPCPRLNPRLSRFTLPQKVRP